MAKLPHQVIQEYARRWQRLKTTVLPKVVGNEVVNFALDNFKRQGFLGATIQPWKKRKPVNGKTDSRAILVKSGRLRRSIQVKTANAETVVVVASTPYAKAHNYGNTERTAVSMHMRTIGTIKSKKRVEVKAHMRQNRMPRRQFLGNSPYLNTRLQRSMGAVIIKTFKT